jgi:hypothetical protein
MLLVYGAATVMILCTLWSLKMVFIDHTLGTDKETTEHFGGIDAHKWPWR